MIKYNKPKLRVSNKIHLYCSNGSSASNTEFVPFSMDNECTTGSTVENDTRNAVSCMSGYANKVGEARFGVNGIVYTTIFDLACDSGMNPNSI